MVRRNLLSLLPLAGEGLDEGLLPSSCKERPSPNPLPQAGEGYEEAASL